MNSTPTKPLGPVAKKVVPRHPAPQPVPTQTQRLVTPKGTPKAKKKVVDPPVDDQGVYRYTCVHCFKPLTSDGSYHFSTNVMYPASKAFWQDSRGLFYCLDKRGDYVQPHKPRPEQMFEALDELENKYADC